MGVVFKFFEYAVCRLLSSWDKFWLAGAAPRAEGRFCWPRPVSPVGVTRRDTHTQRGHSYRAEKAVPCEPGGARLPSFPTLGCRAASGLHSIWSWHSSVTPPGCSGPQTSFALYGTDASEGPVQDFVLDFVPQGLMFPYSRIEVTWCSLFNTSSQRKHCFASSNPGDINLDRLVKVVAARFLHFPVFILSSAHIWGGVVSWGLWEADLLEYDVYAQFLGSSAIHSFPRLCRSTFSFPTTSSTSMQFTCNTGRFICLHSILNYQHVMIELFKFTYTYSSLCVLCDSISFDKHAVIFLPTTSITHSVVLLTPQLPPGSLSIRPVSTSNPQGEMYIWFYKEWFLRWLWHFVLSPGMNESCTSFLSLTGRDGVRFDDFRGPIKHVVACRYGCNLHFPNA